MRFFLLILLLFNIQFFLSPCQLPGNEITIHYRSPQSKKDYRQKFVNEIIKAVMDNTTKRDGPYVMKAIPPMVHRRLAYTQTQLMYTNLIIRITGDLKSVKEFLAIPIPINRGIVGYRIFLIRKNMQNLFSSIKTLKQLKRSKLKAGQGHWNDASILSINEFNVVVGRNYEGLFKMLINKRFDYFPRGVNEAYEELETRRVFFPEMEVEKTIALYYPLPRLLATNKGNKSLAKRIKRGLKIIFADGTHRKIWLRYNRKWVKRARLNKRRIFVMKNPTAINNLPYEKKEYWFHPSEKF